MMDFNEQALARGIQAYNEMVGRIIELEHTEVSMVLNGVIQKRITDAEMNFGRMLMTVQWNVNNPHNRKPYKAKGE